MNELIKKAIINRQIIKFTYKDELRMIEPYTYGISSKNNDILRGYQIEGGSTSSDDLGWRLFTVNKIKNLQILNSKFDLNQEGYNPNDKAMIEIYITA